MSIKEKQRSMVPPAEETPGGTLWLSNHDIYSSIPRKHTILAIFYRHPPNKSDNFFDAEILKESLSRVLVAFYPLAGRLHQNSKSGRLEIDCNGEGALFIEVETTKNITLADLEESNFRPTDELRDLVFPKRDYSGDLSSFPLLFVQLTRFSCGGVALGFAHNHQVGDGAACLHFITSWSRFARGLGLAFNPIHDRTSYIVPRHPPQVQFRHLEYEDPNFVSLPDDLQTASISVTSSQLSKDQIEAIKQEATSWKETSQYKVTTYEVLAAHIWRSACKARGLAPDQEVMAFSGPAHVPVRQAEVSTWHGTSGLGLEWAVPGIRCREAAWAGRAHNTLSTSQNGGLDRTGRTAIFGRGGTSTVHMFGHQWARAGPGQPRADPAVDTPTRGQTRNAS